MNTKSGMRVRRLLLRLGGYALVFLFGASCMFFTVKSGYPGCNVQPTQPANGFARSDDHAATTQSSEEPVQVQMASLYSAIDTVESSGTAEHTPKYTYEEIVTDPEFLGYSKEKQFAILMMYFKDKGFNARPYESYFGREVTKFYQLGLRDCDRDVVASNILISVLNPTVLEGLAYDKEFRLIFPQYCRYYLPYIKGEIIQELITYYDDCCEKTEYKYGERGFYYVPMLSVRVCEYLAEEAFRSGDTFLVQGMGINEDSFTIIFRIDDNMEDDNDN